MSTVTVQNTWQIHRTSGNSFTANIGHVVNEAVVIPSAQIEQNFYLEETSSNTYEIARFPFDATVDVDDAVLSNVASITWYKNGSTVSGSQTLAIGDSLMFTIVRTAGGAASVTLTFTPTDDSTTTNVGDGHYLTWTNLQNMTVDPNFFLATTKTLLAAVNGTDTQDKGANTVESFSGQFTVETEGLSIGSLFGIATDNISTASLLRPKYAWYTQSAGLLQMRVNGGFLGPNVSVPRQNSMTYSLRIVDTGSAIQFWYKPPSGAWTLNLTTTSGYIAGTTYYGDAISSYDAQRHRGFKLLR